MNFPGYVSSPSLSLTLLIYGYDDRIFQLGPAFQINTLLGASLEAQATVAIDLNFKATDALIVFPADAAQESASELDVGDTSAFFLFRLGLGD